MFLDLRAYDNAHAAGGMRSPVRWFCTHFRCAVKLPVKLFDRRLSRFVVEQLLRRGRGRCRLSVHRPLFAPLNVVLSSQSNPYQRHAKAHSVLLGVLLSPTRKKKQLQVDRPAGQRRTHCWETTTTKRCPGRLKLLAASVLRR